MNNKYIYYYHRVLFFLFDKNLLTDRQIEVLNSFQFSEKVFYNLYETRNFVLFHN